MGEMSDYFEDFPEENPAHWDPKGNFDPHWRDEVERQRTAYERLDQILRRERSDSGSASPPR